jgi:hypothetical protein
MSNPNVSLVTNILAHASTRQGSQAQAAARQRDLSLRATSAGGSTRVKIAACFPTPPRQAWRTSAFHPAALNPAALPPPKRSGAIIQSVVTVAVGSRVIRCWYIAEQGGAHPRKAASSSRGSSAGVPCPARCYNPGCYCKGLLLTHTRMHTVFVGRASNPRLQRLKGNSLLLHWGPRHAKMGTGQRTGAQAGSILPAHKIQKGRRFEAPGLGWPRGS